MLADIAQRYYLEGDYNCAESVLLAANEAYGLGLDPDSCYRLVSAFGGGMGCGVVCGALAGGMAALGQAAVTGRAHTTEGFKALCTLCVRDFTDTLGGRDCAQLKPMHFTRETKCLATVRLACDVLERRMAAVREQNA
ncbi:MAG: C-GCAxxG-C-C family (seleno)protein [Candidatus Ventricola sp.]